MIDDLILKTLTKEKSTYRIAKDIKMPYSTVLLHCYDLLLEGKIKMRTIRTISKKANMWKK